MSVTVNKAATLIILGNIHSFMNVIKQFSFNHLHTINDNELKDTWIAFNNKIDLNMHHIDGVIKILAYPVIDGNIVTSECVPVAVFPTEPLKFDARDYFGHADKSCLAPHEIAKTNVIEYLIKEIDYFKFLSNPEDMMMASELYSIFLLLSKKIAH